MGLAIGHQVVSRPVVPRGDARADAEEPQRVFKRSLISSTALSAQPVSSSAIPQLSDSATGGGDDAITALNSLTHPCWSKLAK